MVAVSIARSTVQLPHHGPHGGRDGRGEGEGRVWGGAVWGGEGEGYLSRTCYGGVALRSVSYVCA